jgi:hypothetical protein
MFFRSQITPHFGFTLLVVGVISFVESLLECVFGLPTRECCKTCWCFICRSSINIVAFGSLVSFVSCCDVNLLLSV